MAAQPISAQLADRLAKMILDGEVDYLPEQAFLNVGTIEEAIEKGKKLLDAASHKK